MKVIAEIQSAIDANGHGPDHGHDNMVVDMPYYNGDDAAVAMVAVGQILTQKDPEWTRMKGIRIEL